MSNYADSGGTLLRSCRDVLASRNTIHGCCNRHADNLACDCLDSDNCRHDWVCDKDDVTHYWCKVCFTVSKP